MSYEQELNQIETRLADLRSQRNDLYSKYVGGYDILRIEQEMDKLEKRRTFGRNV